MQSAVAFILHFRSETETTMYLGNAIRYFVGQMVFPSQWIRDKNPRSNTFLSSRK